MSTQRWAENIAHSAVCTYKGGEQNFSPGTSVDLYLVRVTGTGGGCRVLTVISLYVAGRFTGPVRAEGWFTNTNVYVHLTTSKTPLNASF
jgi:hypothetical protein